MSDLQQDLQHAYDKGHETITGISHRWDIHANRRTLIVSVIAGTCAALLYLFVVKPPERFPLNQLVTIEEGKSLGEAGALLEEQGVIRSALVFKTLVTLMGHQRDVHAGDYLFKEPQDVFAIARAVSVGQYGLEPLHIRIPEGATVKKMATIYAADLLRFDPEKFMQLALPQEGYLFPDTYYFFPNASESTIVDSMRQKFDEKIAAIYPPIASSTHSLSDIIIMASILEREAYNTTDRRLIAGVLYNRLARGMPLQVDAVFGYTLGKGTFQLTIKDLTSDSPYNTYKNKGLPPTPIGSPSVDSIEAALNPTKNDYLFFLADRSGVTHYCKTYACQLANKAKYF